MTTIKFAQYFFMVMVILSDFTRISHSYTQHVRRMKTLCIMVAIMQLKVLNIENLFTENSVLSFKNDFSNYTDIYRLT